jgi:hypothetical protein
VDTAEIFESILAGATRMAETEPANTRERIEFAGLVARCVLGGLVVAARGGHYEQLCDLAEISGAWLLAYERDTIEACDEDTLAAAAAGLARFHAPPADGSANGGQGPTIAELLASVYPEHRPSLVVVAEPDS